MTRIVLHGGQVFDGTGSDPSAADVAIEDAAIVDVGTGLDGGQQVDAALLDGDGHRAAINLNRIVMSSLIAEDVDTLPATSYSSATAWLSKLNLFVVDPSTDEEMSMG
jgi:hypothetical protein